MSIEEEYKKRCEDQTKEMLAMGIEPIDIATYWETKYVKMLCLMQTMLEKELNSSYILNL